MKISIITVVYNGIKEIEQTILSVLSQDYNKVEYIVIDGGSNDGTVEVIKKYSDSIDYWISEKDYGFYDALNKGIIKATGSWIGILNCGDAFNNKHVISDVFKGTINDDICVLYGDSLEIIGSKKYLHVATPRGINKRTPPDYRHGASFVRSDIHKKFLFDLSKTPVYGYALDYLQINQIYKAGYAFQKVDVIVLQYDGEGMSSHRWKNKYLRALTENDGKKNVSFYVILIKSIFRAIVNKLNRNIKTYDEEYGS